MCRSPNDDFMTEAAMAAIAASASTAISKRRVRFDLDPGLTDAPVLPQAKPPSVALRSASAVAAARAERRAALR